MPYPQRVNLVESCCPRTANTWQELEGFENSRRRLLEGWCMGCLLSRIYRKKNTMFRFRQVSGVRSIQIGIADCIYLQGHSRLCSPLRKDHLTLGRIRTLSHTHTMASTWVSHAVEQCGNKKNKKMLWTIRFCVSGGSQHMFLHN